MANSRNTMRNPVNILYADDDIDDRMLFKEALSNSEAPVSLKLFDNGDSLEDELKSTNYQCDLVFLDLNMPGRDGLAVLKSLQNPIKLNALRVIVFTTAGSSDIVKKAFDLNAILFVEKPNSFKVLQKTLETIVEQKNQYSIPVTYDRFKFRLPHNK